MSGKEFQESKTLWFNGVALVLGIAVQLGFRDFIPAPEIEPLAKGLVALVTVAMPILGPIINMGLRLVTKERIVMTRRR